MNKVRSTDGSTQTAGTMIDRRKYTHSGNKTRQTDGSTQTARPKVDRREYTDSRTKGRQTGVHRQQDQR